MVVVSFVAVEDQLHSSGQPGGSWAFSFAAEPRLALTHCAIQRTDRIFTLLWAPPPLYVWVDLKSLQDFFFPPIFFFWCECKSRQFAFVSVLKILQVNWDRRISNAPQRVFLFLAVFIILSSIWVPPPLPPLFSQSSVHRDKVFLLCKKSNWSRE